MEPLGHGSKHGRHNHEYRYVKSWATLSQCLSTFFAVLPYFAESPYFDFTSNNATLSTQALNNQNMFYIIQTREAFEGRLKTMQGLEFMVTHDPSENDTKRDHNGVWVIRKQIRRKRPGMQDEITGISSYYVVGINVYMAPTVGNIIGSRMVRLDAETRARAH